ncbi:hypothetical protein ABZ639_02580 [Saccharomonospora sp. NPDC006951]
MRRQATHHSVVLNADLAVLNADLAVLNAELGVLNAELGGLGAGLAHGNPDSAGKHPRPVSRIYLYIGAVLT